RVVAGARSSVTISLLSASVATVIGTTVGLLSGATGGRLDFIVQRFVDALQAYPGIVLALVVVSLVGPGTVPLSLTIGVLFSASFSRVVRSASLPLQSAMFVVAARSSGASSLRILGRHILPNIVATVLIMASLSLGSA